ncbi:hypothetical protein [Ktedonospora formicarum]|uniref:hypothetical protein n=1 Tax=Ktedonospora formicarum TaxID=2778364 RepID=UPI001C68E2C4|nr:hypothetical protein [Ktedonospora formicarum]
MLPKSYWNSFCATGSAEELRASFLSILMYAIKGSGLRPADGGYFCIVRTRGESEQAVKIFANTTRTAVLANKGFTIGVLSD